MSIEWRQPDWKRAGAVLVVCAVLVALPRTSQAAPAAGATPVLDPQFTRFPRCSQVSFEGLLDPPAGKHGFLSVGNDGHFHFANGRRARFFGINVASRSLFVADEVIDQVVDTLAHAGFNLVRLHHFDDVYGVFDDQSGRPARLSPQRLRTLDYWIARCKARGIHVYLDLLDYRTFTEAEGVANAAALGRGAKPYACFDSRLIELQKQYATALLSEHVNEFTGLSYAADPAVALIEICDENGLLIKHSLWRKLAPPYEARLQQRWNAFLRQRHGTTAQLSRAWTNYRGECALLPHESLERGTVELPQMELGRLNDSPYAASVRSPARKNEGALFAYTVQREYLAEMKRHLRGLGVRAPLTAVVSNHQLPDLKSVADELDFIGNNFYWDHPFWPTGNSWKLPACFTGRNPVADDSEFGFAPWASLSRVAGKPLVVREWGYCWPNEFRSTGMVEATAYALHQDFDALLLFTYGAEPEGEALGYFDVHADPARWGLVGACATAFLRGDVQPAKQRASFCYSAVDTFYYYQYYNPVRRLAWVAGVQNRFYEDSLTAGGGLHLSSGRSGSGRVLGRERILYANGRSVDLTDSARSPTAPWVTEQNLLTHPSARRTVDFSGLIFNRGARGTFQLWPPLDLAAVRARNCEPLGVAAATNECYGMYDPHTRSFLFNSLADENVLRLSLDALQRLYSISTSHRAVDSGTYVTDTGELSRVIGAGRLSVNTPRLLCLGGQLTAQPLRVGPLTVTGLDGAATVLVQSLNAQPVTEAADLLVKVVTDATNTGQRVEQAGSGTRGVIRAFGSPPVITTGKPSAVPWRLAIAGIGVFEIYQQGGNFEIVRQNGGWHWWTDTPGAGLRLPAFGDFAQIVRHGRSGESTPLVVNEGVLRYPVDTFSVEVLPPRAG